MTIDPGTTDRINAFCVEKRITKSVFLLGVFKLILRKTINQNDITVGMPVAGRRYEDLDKIVGVFLNVILLRSHIRSDMTFEQYLKELEDNVAEALEYQDYPYEELYAKAKEELGFMGGSLFSVLFNYMPGQSSDVISFGEISSRPYNLEEIEPKYDLTLYASESKDTINLKAVYKSNLYDGELVERLLGRFGTVTGMVLDRGDISVGRINFKETGSQDEYDRVFEGDFDDEGFEL